MIKLKLKKKILVRFRVLIVTNRPDNGSSMHLFKAEQFLPHNMAQHPEDMAYRDQKSA
jgi:hypothetical protein